MATHVNGNDGFGARSDGGFRKLGINAIGFERNVDHDRKRTRIEDSTRCGDKGEVGKNDFIARANAERGHRDFQSGGAVGNGDAELRAVKSCSKASVRVPGVRHQTRLSRTSVSALRSTSSYCGQTGNGLLFDFLPPLSASSAIESP